MTVTASPSLPRVPLTRALIAFAPGLAIAVALAVVSYGAAQASGAPALLIALVAGVALSSVCAQPRLAPGFDFAAKPMLRLGVALLGARITFDQVAALGPGAVLLTIAALAASLAFGLFVARLMRLESALAFILAGATAICGASAALAIAAALPRHERTETAAALSVAGVTVMGALCMLAFPLLAHSLNLSPRETGIFLGASLHEVAQAVGAGYAVSPEAGDTAVLVKLIRVACLGPVVLGISWSLHSGAKRTLAPPWFVTGFVAMAVLASTSLLPLSAIHAASAASQWLLLIAIAALGLKTSFAKLAAIGARPLIMLSLQTLFLAAITLGAILLLRAR